MSETEKEPTTAPEQPTVPEAAPAPEAGAVKRRRGRIARAAGAVLLAGAVVAGVGFTVVTVRDADRDAGAPRWQFPKTKATEQKAPPAQGLAGMLVPYGTDGWLRGPDLGGFGADAQLSGAQATALRKESLKDLPRTLRKRLEKEIDRQRVTGMAMRSYVSGEASLYNEDGVFTMRLVLARMDKTAVRNTARSQSAFLDALEIFRAGPKIKGHKNASCFLPPKDDDSELDTMVCTAYVGDVLVTATADGPKPLDTKGAAELLRRQLDRIQDTGEAV
ncbi:hypothetical protein [Streptomyces griseosporeus]|uniref:hypothetical protein n=1 Tax=Streptomyces griseosporeus TaxID=1910 RepID=UPI0036FCCC80